MIRNIVIISDTHFGCQYALSPPRVKLDGGGYYTYSKFQKAVWQRWRDFWNKYVPTFTKDEPFVLVHLGDCIDGTHHGSTTQISHNITDQISMAYDVLEPHVKKAARYFHIRGTEAHVGKSGAYEEELAQMLGAEPDESGNYARWELWLEMNKQLIHFSHHIGGTSASAYESTAVYRELVEAFVAAGRFGDRPPDMVVRGHRHREFQIKLGGERYAIVCPGWQLKSPFIHRIASGRAAPPQIGGYVIRSGEGDALYARCKVWHIPRSKEVKI